MRFFFKPYSPDTCCLCGSENDLTGEHKIKASAIRSEFGSDKMVIGTFGKSIENLRNVQGPKSKNLHFNARLCRECNSARTQEQDREFDRFHIAARTMLEKGEDPKDIFNADRYQKDTNAYLNVFRYFAKILCCHIAEIESPRPVRMSRFAISLTNANRVWLDINRDEVHKELVKVHGELQYAAHGGLAVYGDKIDGGINTFQSTLTIGPIRYVFFWQLSRLEKLELKLGHRKFHNWAKSKTLDAIDQQLSE